MNAWLITLLLLVHFIADFPLQSDWMAQGKSKSLLPLGTHILVYTSCLTIGTIAVTPIWWWAPLNGVAHGVIDFFTSRATSHYFGKKDFHNGFVVVGFDQFLHTALLVLTWWWLS